MEITITISLELLPLLQKRADAHGVSIEQMASMIVSEALQRPTLDEIRVRVGSRA